MVFKHLQNLFDQKDLIDDLSQIFLIFFYVDVLMSRILWILFGKIWIQNVGDTDFEVISAAENSNKFQKTRFWKEKSVEMW
jgi:hypothetical protein